MLRLQPLFGMILYLVAGSGLLAQGKTEQKFRDPKTNKSGKYTVKFGGPSAGAKSMGLLVFFHGSGNTSGYAGSFDVLESLAQSFKLVPLAIQAPNDAITWPDSGRGPSNQHTVYARSLLDQVIFNNHPEIDPGRVVFVGFSAGSTFLSGDFLPRYIKDFKGGVVLLCGGGGPVTQSPETFSALPADVAKVFSFYAYIQKGDFLYGQTREGLAYWRSRGAVVEAETPEGGSHCSFDMAKELKRGLSFILK